MNQIDEGPLFRNTDPPTSKAAGAKIRPSLTTWYGKILKVLAGSHDGHNCDELAELTGGKYRTITPRIKPLLGAGLVEVFSLWRCSRTQERMSQCCCGECVEEFHLMTRNGQRVIKITDAGRRWLSEV